MPQSKHTLEQFSPLRTGIDGRGSADLACRLQDLSVKCLRMSAIQAVSASDPEVSLILPAYNEAATIRNTIAEAVDYFSQRGIRYEIIVAADGDDGTREAVAEMSLRNPALRALGGKERRGKGRGVR